MSLEQNIETATIMLNSMIRELELKERYASFFHKFKDQYSLEQLRIIKKVLHDKNIIPELSLGDAKK